MGKIVVNKNFQSKYLYRAFERLVKPDTDINTVIRHNNDGNGYNETRNCTNITPPIPCYIDLSSTYKTTWLGVDDFWDTTAFNVSHLVPHQYLLCDETFITLLNKINKNAKNGMTIFPKTVNYVPSTAVTGSNRTANLNIMLLVGSLFSPKKTVRDGAIDYFVSSSFITAEEGNQIKGILSIFKLVDNNYTRDSYGGVYVPKATTDITTTYNSNVLDMIFNKVLRLDSPYKQSTENISNQQLYILVIPYCDTKFIDGFTNKVVHWAGSSADLNVLNSTSFNTYPYESDIGKVMVGYQTFHNKVANTVVPQIPYIALSLTEVGAGGDIEYDHLDEIEYLDEIKITINLPKEYN